jgi:hypothetical protein
MGFTGMARLGMRDFLGPHPHPLSKGEGTSFFLHRKNEPVKYGMAVFGGIQRLIAAHQRRALFR